jgi:hypothetical protein
MGTTACRAVAVEAKCQQRCVRHGSAGYSHNMIWLLLFILLILIVGVVGAVKIALWVILLAVLVAVLAGFMGRSLFSR